MKALNVVNLHLSLDPHARAPRSRTVYTGHVGEGGLQGHSVGGCYPFTVYGYTSEPGAPTAYGVLNAATGDDTGPLFTSAARAWEVAEDCKEGKTDPGIVRFRAEQWGLS